MISSTSQASLYGISDIIPHAYYSWQSLQPLKAPKSRGVDFKNAETSEVSIYILVYITSFFAYLSTRIFNYLRGSIQNTGFALLDAYYNAFSGFPDSHQISPNPTSLWRPHVRR